MKIAPLYCPYVGVGFVKRYDNDITVLCKWELVVNSAYLPLLPSLKPKGRGQLPFAWMTSMTELREITFTTT